jgi:hypothetical protein
VFASVLAYLSFNRIVALVGPNMAGLAVHLVPVFGTLLAILLLGEVLRRHHAVGMALIAAGILFAVRKGGDPPRVSGGQAGPDRVVAQGQDAAPQSVLLGSAPAAFILMALGCRG